MRYELLYGWKLAKLHLKSKCYVMKLPFVLPGTIPNELEIISSKLSLQHFEILSTYSLVTVGV